MLPLIAALQTLLILVVRPLYRAARRTPREASTGGSDRPRS